MRLLGTFEKRNRGRFTEWSGIGHSSKSWPGSMYFKIAIRSFICYVIAVGTTILPNFKVNCRRVKKISNILLQWKKKLIINSQLPKKSQKLKILNDIKQQHFSFSPFIHLNYRPTLERFQL